MPDLAQRVGDQIDKSLPGLVYLMKKTIEQRFPDAAARTVADQAIDKLAETATMAQYIDAWIAEYKRVGGKVKS